jgi:DNA-binding transcriptional regulator YiaG
MNQRVQGVSQGSLQAAVAPLPLCLTAAGDDAGAATQPDPPSTSYAQMPLRMAGAEVAELRMSVGWSQADLARRIAYSQRQVSRWERGQQPVSQEACLAILRAVVVARQASEDTRRARYYLRRWLRETSDLIISTIGLG